MDRLQTEALAAADVAHMVHPITRQRAHSQSGPIIVVSGRGAILTLADGREVIDGTAGLWCVNVGHGRRELARAAAEQMERLAYSQTFSSFASAPVIELARRLAELAPGDLTAAFFASGGGEANESAFKLARYYWRLRGMPSKTVILSHYRGYHGLSLGAASATGLDEYHGDFGPLAPDFAKVPAPYRYRYGEGPLAGHDADSVESGDALAERIEELGSERVAAFIAEPVLGTGGVVVPPDGYLRAVAEVCERYGVLFIADEVITGFGRTGHWFGVQRDGVIPDIMTFAKGVTSGYVPLGGAMLREHVRATLQSAPGDPPLMHGFTYSGHPVACAVALANLDVLEGEGLVDAVAEKGRYLVARLEELRSLPEVGDVRSAGLMAAVELVEDRATKSPFPSERGRAAAVVSAARERGLLTRALLGDMLQLSPPFVVSHEEMDRAVDILREAIIASR